MKKVSYLSRGKQKTLTEIDNVYAFQLKDKEEFSKYDLGEREFVQTDEIEFNINQDDIKELSKEGWYFVKPNAQVQNKIKTGEQIEGVVRKGKVLLDKNGKIKICNNVLIIQFVEEFTEEEINQLLREYNLTILNRLKFGKNLYQVMTEEGIDIIQLSNDLISRNKITVAEPDFIENIGLRFVPTDPSYTRQWQWNNDGSNGGVAGADVSAEQAWDITRGRDVTIAVLDRGFDVSHPDLAPALTDQSGFFSGNPSTFAQDTSASFPDRDHGTFCAGMALARANNGQSGCGIANEANFTAVRYSGGQTIIARAIAYAADPSTEVPTENSENGADIISVSEGPDGQADWDITPQLEQAIQFAVDNGRRGLGTPIFWAVTNGNFTIDGVDGTDEVVSNENVIAVGASTRSDTRATGGFGPELDFVAPGRSVVNIVNPSSTNADSESMRTWSGTSFAAPTAAGVAALVLSIAPRLNWEQLRQLLRDTCDKIGTIAYGTDGHNDTFGYGRINASRAVQEALLYQAEDDKVISVVGETATGRNIRFRDNETLEIFDKEEFVRRIQNGNYPQYHVMEIRLPNGEIDLIPRSNPDSEPNNNLG